MKAMRIRPGKKPEVVAIGLRDAEARRKSERFRVLPIEKEDVMILEDLRERRKRNWNRFLPDAEGKPFRILAGPLLLFGMQEKKAAPLTEDQIRNWTERLKMPDRFRTDGNRVIHPSGAEFYVPDAGAALKGVLLDPGQADGEKTPMAPVSFPVSEEELELACRQLGKSRKESGSLQCRCTCCVPGYEDLLTGETPVPTLNRLAETLERLGPPEREKLEAVLLLERPGELSQAIRLAGTLKNWELQEDVHGDRELGERCLTGNRMFLSGDGSGYLRYLDLERLGRDVRIREHGLHTAYGYVYRKECGKKQAGT